MNHPGSNDGCCGEHEEDASDECKQFQTNAGMARHDTLASGHDYLNKDPPEYGTYRYCYATEQGSQTVRGCTTYRPYKETS